MPLSELSMGQYNLTTQGKNRTNRCALWTPFIGLRDGVQSKQKETGYKKLTKVAELQFVEHTLHRFHSGPLKSVGFLYFICRCFNVSNMILLEALKELHLVTLLDKTLPVTFELVP